MDVTAARDAEECFSPRRHRTSGTDFQHPGQDDIPAHGRRLQPVLADDQGALRRRTARHRGAGDEPSAGRGCRLVRADLEKLEVAVTTRPQVPEVAVWSDGEDNEFCGFASALPSTESAPSRSGPTLTLATGRQTGLPLETRGLYASWDGDRVDIWGITKYVHASREELARIFAMSVDDIIVHRVDWAACSDPAATSIRDDGSRSVGGAATGPCRLDRGPQKTLLSSNHSRDQFTPRSVHDGVRGERVAGSATGPPSTAGPTHASTRSLMAQHTAESLAGPLMESRLDVDVRGRASNRTPTGTMRGPPV